MLTRTKRNQSGKDRRRRRPHSCERRTSDLLNNNNNNSSDCSSLNSPSSSSGSCEAQLYWDISLDQDLLQTIAFFYPDWFSDCVMEDTNGDMGSPRAVVDEASIQQAMDKNKESLKVKLLLRRPIGQLVEQGILPRKC